MNRRFVRVLLCGAVFASLLMVSAQADAGWDHRGSWGAPYYGWGDYSYNYSYYAGWGGGGLGCCTPSYTVGYTPYYAASFGSCYDPCYRGRCGGLLSRLAYRWRTHHYGYYGGCDTRWTVPSCCYSCGCVIDECGCGGVSTGVQYGEPSIVPEGPPRVPTPADLPPDDPNDALPEKRTSLTRDSALLTVNVPQGARVLVNGMPTRSTGSLRRYVSRNLTPGFDYTYEVKAEMMVDGTPMIQSKTVQLRAGQKAQLAFDMNAAPQLETALTLNVPAGAKVYLAGNETRGDGTVRTFRTTKLADGQAWSNYLVRVVLNDNGESLTKEEMITLQAGERRELTFDFNIDKVAAAR